MDARELDQGTSGGGYRQRRCILSSTLAARNSGVEVEPYTNACHRIGGGFSERDGVLAAKKGTKGKSRRIWRIEVLGQVGSSSRGEYIKVGTVA
jgi:hypothetical protein